LWREQQNNFCPLASKHAQYCGKCGKETNGNAIFFLHLLGLFLTFLVPDLKEEDKIKSVKILIGADLEFPV